MGKKLYRVRVVLFVMAENESDACMAATQARFDIFECAARRAKNVDPAWQAAIPYNAEDDRTCAEILTDTQPAVVHPKTHPVSLPLYIEAAIRTFDFDNQSIQPRQQI